MAEEGKEIDTPAERLKYLRETLLDLSQTMFGQITGYHKDTIWKLENGALELTQKRIAKIIMHLNPANKFLAQNIDKHDLDRRIIQIIEEIDIVNYFVKPQSVEKSPTPNTLTQQPDSSGVDNNKAITTPTPVKSSDAYTRLVIDLPSTISEQHSHEDDLYEYLAIKAREKYFYLGNLEKRSFEELLEINEKYIHSFDAIDYYVPAGNQFLVYALTKSIPPSDISLQNAVPSTLHKEKISPRSTHIMINMLGRSDQEPQHDYWIREFTHLKNKLKKYNEDIKQSNTTSTLYVFALAPQPLVVELGHLLGDISKIIILNPHRKKPLGSVSWKWTQTFKKLEFSPEDSKTTNDIVVLNLSLNTLIKKSKIERALSSSELSIWKLTIEEPKEHFLESKKELNDFKISFRAILDRIVNMHDNCKELNVFLSVPIPIAFEIGRLWNPDSDPELILFGLSGESGDYYPIHTLKKNQ